MEEKRALISVYDKMGIEDFARRLVKLGWKIISSGGTAKMLAYEGIPVTDVAELVGGGAILDHRVVTLSRQVHAALLANPDKPEDVAELEKLRIPVIDLLCCDFYPLNEAIEHSDATIESVVEMTDIGGPTMVRSAAKGGRIVICRVADRERVLQMLEKLGDVPPNIRQELRARAELEVANYCLASATFHSKGAFSGLLGEKVIDIPKGENGPQSPAALYSTGSDDPLALENFKVIEGQPLGYNNICDIDRCLQTLTHVASAFFKLGDGATDIAIGVKHGNPCGAAARFPGFEKDVVEMMVTGDTRAIFGGTVMCNFIITEELAEAMVSAGMTEGRTQKFDCVVAQGFDDKALDTLSRKGSKCRMVANLSLNNMQRLLDNSPRIRQVRGGFLKQPNYCFVLNSESSHIRVFGETSRRQDLNLALAWAVCATSNSNTITIVNDGMLIGNGVGQQDRVGAAELAIKRAIDAGHKDKLQGAVACSDSFFPFPDGVQVLIDAGIGAIFSTSGSINDEKVQKLCMDNGVTLYQLPDSEARGFFGH